MPNTTMLVVGAMGLFYLMRNQGAGTDKPGTLASLLSADNRSSGMSPGGVSSAEVSTPTGGAVPFDLMGWLAGRTTVLDSSSNPSAAVVGANQVVATEVTVDGPVIKEAPNNITNPPDLIGPLSPFFDFLGPTTSSISGEAVRKVGLLTQYDPKGMVKIGFVGESGYMVDDIQNQTIEVVAATGPNVVATTEGTDGTTVVTTGGFQGISYFSNQATLLASVDQGYFDIPSSPEVVLEADAQAFSDASESAWDAAHGFADRHAVVVPVPVLAPVAPQSQAFDFEFAGQPTAPAFYSDYDIADTAPALNQDWAWAGL